MDELMELLKSIRNRVDIATILINLGRDELLPTILEDMYQDCQTITDEYCVVKENKKNG